MARSDSSGRLDDRLVRPEDGEKVAVAEDLDRPLRGAPESGLVNGRDRRAAARLAHNARMHHPVKGYVVGKSRATEHLRGKVEARHVLADHAVVADALRHRAAGGGAREIHRAGKRPIIMAG